MAFGRLSRRRQQDAIIGSSQVLHSPEGSVDTNVKRSRPDEDWQSTAWQYYEAVPQVWFGVNYVANALRRVRLVPARVSHDGSAPQILEPGDEGFTTANDVLNTIRDDDGGHGDIIHDMAVQLSVPGEGVLVSYRELDPTTKERSGEELWEVVSADEVKVDKIVGGDRYSLVDPDQRGGDIVLDYAGRFWRRSPKRRNRADSAMKAVLDDCETLIVLNHYIRSAARAKHNAGIMAVPSELTVHLPESMQMQMQSEVAKGTDPLIEAITRYVTTSIANESDPANVAPAILRGKADLLEKLRVIDLSRPFDTVALRLRQDAIRQIAAGLDMPAEVMLGIGSLNHWSAWQVTDDAYKAHLEPLTQLIVGAITDLVYRPALLPDDIICWYDPSALISHPHRVSSIFAAFDRGVIGRVAVRRYLGYAESDAPLPEEIEARSESTPDETPSDDPPPADETEQLPPEEDEIAASSLAMLASAELQQLGIDLQGIDQRLIRTLEDEIQALVERHEDGEMTSVELQHEIERLFEENAEVAAGAALSTIRQYAEDDIDAGLLQQDQTSNIAIAAAILGAAAIGAASRSAAPMDEGELPAMQTRVPTQTIREAVVSAGGGPMSGAPSTVGGIATGADVESELVRIGIRVSQWQWVYGDSARVTPFQSHLDLDGIVFSEWDDERLAVRSSDAWIGASHYYPGDHLYCQCDFVPVLSTDQE